MRSKLKKDSTFKEFWRDNERFADLFNGAVFGGREVICAKSLQEMDTDVSGTIKMDGYSEGLERRRDVIKKFAAGMTFVLLGVEAQQHIHYAMPLRHMLYDGMGYLKEYRSLPAKTGKFQTSDEFLSKMKKEDKLHPIITLTVYYGETPWDGPLNLRDMMTDMPRQYTGNDLRKCLERLILLDFSAVRQRGKVEFRPGLDHLKCVKNETKIIKWEALYMILFM